MAAPEPDTTGRPTPPAETDRGAVEQRFDRDSLYALRAAVAAHAGALGAPTPRMEHMVLIANELATNAVAYAGGHGELRLWRDGNDLYCQVSDHGPGLNEPGTARSRPPPPKATGGRGLWIVRQLCDQLDVASSPHGTTITATMHLDPT